MKIVFLGTPDFATPTLRALHESTHEVVLVVTRPSRPVGRRKVMSPPAVYLAADELELSCIQPQSVNSDRALATIRATDSDVLVTVAYGRLLRSEILNLAPQGVLNLHPSLLPRYRGASPVQAAIAAGEERTGVTVLRTDEGWDSGPIYASESVMIGPHEIATALSGRLAGVGAGLMVKTLDKIESGGLDPGPQDESIATMTDVHRLQPLPRPPSLARHPHDRRQPAAQDPRLPASSRNHRGGPGHPRPDRGPAPGRLRRGLPGDPRNPA